MLYCMRMLLGAAKNIVSMKETWTLQKVELMENKYKHNLFEIGAGIIKDVCEIMQEKK